MVMRGHKDQPGISHPYLSHHCHKSLSTFLTFKPSPPHTGFVPWTSLISFSPDLFYPPKGFFFCLKKFVFFSHWVQCHIEQYFRYILVTGHAVFFGVISCNSSFFANNWPLLYWKERWRAFLPQRT